LEKIMDKVLQAIGLCKKAGKLTFGADGVVDAIRAKKAKVVIVAADASQNTVKKITDKATFYGINCEIVNYTQKELGRAIGKQVCAAVAICDDNMAKMYSAAKLKTAEVN
jgi:ribosomal protein L7Ae-like RNA K-turn-binding protein